MVRTQHPYRVGQGRLEQWDRPAQVPGRPVGGGEVVPRRQRRRVVGTQHPYRVGQGRLEQWDRPAQVPGRPVGGGEVVPRRQRRRVVGTQHPYRVGQGRLEQWDRPAQVPGRPVGVGEVVPPRQRVRVVGGQLGDGLLEECGRALVLVGVVERRCDCYEGDGVVNCLRGLVDELGEPQRHLHIKRRRPIQEVAITTGCRDVATQLPPRGFLKLGPVRRVDTLGEHLRQQRLPELVPPSHSRTQTVIHGVRQPSRRLLARHLQGMLCGSPDHTGGVGPGRSAGRQGPFRRYYRFSYPGRKLSNPLVVELLERLRQPRQVHGVQRQRTIVATDSPLDGIQAENQLQCEWVRISGHHSVGVSVQSLRG